MKLLAKKIVKILTKKKLTISFAESCTGGMISSAITAIKGSSKVFTFGFIVYSNKSKINLLKVSKNIIKKYGAVSAQVAEAMVGGVIARSNASAGLAITGVAGPDGGSVQKPVGTVFIAWQVPEHGVRSERFQFHGDRDAIRRQSVAAALAELVSLAARPV